MSLIPCLCGSDSKSEGIRGEPQSQGLKTIPRCLPLNDTPRHFTSSLFPRHCKPPPTSCSLASHSRTRMREAEQAGREKKMRNQCSNNIKGRSLSAGLPWERRRGPEPARTDPRRPGAGSARDQNNKDSLWQSSGAAVREEWNQMWHFSFICKCLLGGTLTRNDSWALTKLGGADGRIEGSWQRL